MLAVYQVAEVATLLLTTKLNIPPARFPLVKRPRLMELLREGLKYNLILVSAPAGFGKTTLLSDWAHQNHPRIRTAWVSLDEGDNEPVRFWDYFIAALQKLKSTVGENALALLHTSQTFPGQAAHIESILTALINDLTSIPADFVVVLDDYHLIKSHQIHDGITYLLEHMLAEMHLVIATRADLPLPLARFRGKGMMLEIRTDDLRFNLDDATSLLREMKTVELSAEDVTALNERTEGWAVGLKMAALSLRQQEDIPGFLASFTGSQRYVMDYLMEEVLQKQTEEIRDFLLKTSVLNRLTAPLCDAVTGRKNGDEILLLLERAHLFIVPMDESRQWYRYEHLFAELLRHQLELVSGAKRVVELHRRASQWYEDNSYPYEAIHHALAAQDWEGAARIIDDVGLKKSRRGEYATLLNWFQALPEEVFLSHSQLCIWYGLALMIEGQLEAAESKLKYLEKVAQDNPSIQGEIATVQTYIAFRRGDTPRTIELGRKALSLLPPDKLDARSGVGLALGWIYWNRGQFKEAEPLLTEAYENARQAGNYLNVSQSLSLLASIVSLGGKLRRAAEQHQKAIELAGASPAAALPHCSLSALLYEWNDLGAAANHIQRAIELAQLEGNTELLSRAYGILARIRIAQGDEAGALKALEKVDFAAHKISSLPSARAEQAAFHILLALRQGDLATASKWGSKVAEDANDLPFFFSHVPIRLLIAQGKKPVALEKLQTLYKETVQGGVQSDLIAIRMNQALAADTVDSAVELVAEVLAMAEPEGYIRIFVDEGKLLAPLLRKAISQGIKPEYAAKLLAIIEAEKRRKPKTKAGGALLSERELEILRLLASEISNQQIAERLFISTGTVKVHVHNILEKLGAKGRSQAVARAREIKII